MLDSVRADVAGTCSTSRTSGAMRLTVVAASPKAPAAVDRSVHDWFRSSSPAIARSSAPPEIPLLALASACWPVLSDWRKLASSPYAATPATTNRPAATLSKNRRTFNSVCFRYS
jgi:hypothetical protein